LTSTLEKNFSHHFPGKIWTLVAATDKNLLFIEIRDEANFQVSFYALEYTANEFVWKDLRLKESWWVSLQAAHGDMALFQSYMSKGNPDHKKLIGFDIFNKTIRWEVEEFSFYDWNDTTILGYLTNGDIQPAIIDRETGAVQAVGWENKTSVRDTHSKSPAQYLEESTHFESVKSFILQKTGWTIVRGVEYLEMDGRIMVSAYSDHEGSLANYLLVFNQAGTLLMQEKLGEKLEGLGTDTFFVLSGCLFFVKNKSELVAYRLYD